MHLSLQSLYYCLPVMVSLRSITVLVACLLPAASAAAVVERDPNGPTGYQVTFRYRPPPDSPEPANVSMGSGFLYTDPLHTTSETAANYLPSQWKPDYVNFGSYLDLISGEAPSLNMGMDKETGDWVLTLPFPSGTFQYSFLVNCTPPVIYCPGTVDTDNPPIEMLAGEQTSSIVQVPFDKTFQTVDNTWQLPLEDKNRRGHIGFFNYTSPGSTYPTTDVHVAGVYLPPGYSEFQQYPVIYFHHGRGGNHADWFNQGRLQNIVDRLIDNGDIPPIIIITPNFYDLGFAPEDFATNDTNYHYTTYDQNGLYAFDAAVRRNYFEHLMPFVEETWPVGRLPANRTFVGLSMGGGLSTEMLYNATDYFDSFGVFSQVPYIPPVPEASVSMFQLKKLLLGAGLYDFALPSTLNAESTLAQAGVDNIKSHISPCGGHSWCVWQELARVFLKDVLFAK